MYSILKTDISLDCIPMMFFNMEDFKNTDKELSRSNSVVIDVLDGSDDCDNNNIAINVLTYLDMNLNHIRELTLRLPDYTDTGLYFHYLSLINKMRDLVVLRMYTSMNHLHANLFVNELNVNLRVFHFYINPLMKTYVITKASRYITELLELRTNLIISIKVLRRCINLRSLTLHITDNIWRALIDIIPTQLVTLGLANFNNSRISLKRISRIQKRLKYLMFVEDYSIIYKHKQLKHLPELTGVIFFHLSYQPHDQEEVRQHLEQSSFTNHISKDYRVFLSHTSGSQGDWLRNLKM